MSQRLDLPTGQILIPDWCLGADVRWDMVYHSPPRLILKAGAGYHTWDNQNWEYADTGHWQTFSPDCRSRRYSHGDELTLGGDDIYDTPDHEGLGGSPVMIWSQGRRIRLNGPWCNGPAKGYHEVCYVDTFAWRNKGVPWSEGQKLCGPDISTDLFLRIVARFLPYLEVWDQCDQCFPLQISRAEWGVTKAEWMRVAL